MPDAILLSVVVRIRMQTSKQVAITNATQCMQIKRSSQKIPSIYFCNFVSRLKARPSAIARITAGKLKQIQERVKPRLLHI